MKVEDVTGGDTRAGLEAIRDQLAVAMSVADPNVVAQIAGRLQAVILAIEALPPSEQRRSKLDELAERRKGRSAAPATPAPAARSRRKGSGRGSG